MPYSVPDTPGSLRVGNFALADSSATFGLSSPASVPELLALKVAC